VGVLATNPDLLGQSGQAGSLPGNQRTGYSGNNSYNGSPGGTSQYPGGPSVGPITISVGGPGGKKSSKSSENENEYESNENESNENESNENENENENESNEYQSKSKGKSKGKSKTSNENESNENENENENEGPESPPGTPGAQLSALGKELQTATKGLSPEVLTDKFIGELNKKL
jgi:hypothetical protein